MIITCSKLISSLSPSYTNIIDNGAIVLKHDKILSIGQTSDIISQFHGHSVVQIKNAVIMPGLINAHVHLELPALLASIRAPHFPGWVVNLIRAKKTLSSDDYLAAAQNNINTSIQAGTTTVGEICTHDVSPGVLKQSGLRAVVYKELISMDPLRKIRSFSSLLFRPTSLVQAGLSPHSPFTVSESVLKDVNRIAKKKDLRLAMHIAESQDEIRLLQGKKSGLSELYRLAGWDLSWAPSAASSVEYLKRIRLLSPALLAVHAVHVTNGDISMIRKSKTPIAHCPRSNNETAVGKMPLKKYLDAGVFVGLGTDSLASSPTLNMWDEMRYAYRLHHRDGITARDILALATFGGARVLGMGADIGSLEKGKKADLIAVRLPHKETGDIYSDLLRETKSCIMTMVNGKILYRDNS
jgi:cytosine/adenosine deaminase-related metal-dependent hydrolase